MTLLFLDANAALRGERTLALRQQPGWEVTAAASMAEALEWLTQATSLDLLITEAMVSSAW